MFLLSNQRELYGLFWIIFVLSIPGATTRAVKIREAAIQWLAAKKLAQGAASTLPCHCISPLCNTPTFYWRFRMPLQWERNSDLRIVLVLGCTPSPEESQHCNNTRLSAASECSINSFYQKVTTCWIPRKSSALEFTSRATVIKPQLRSNLGNLFCYLIKQHLCTTPITKAGI